MALNRDEILAMVDLTKKEITVPSNILVWGGKTLFIKQLSRGDQDTYLKRQFGTGIVSATGNTEFQMVGLYGHDSWLCSRGICDSEGKRIFTEDDLPMLEEKSGEFIGWCAQEILKFSEMDKDAKIAKKAAKAQQKSELKN
jgi:hypothetical protein